MELPPQASAPLHARPQSTIPPTPLIAIPAVSAPSRPILVLILGILFILSGVGSLYGCIIRLFNFLHPRSFVQEVSTLTHVDICIQFIGVPLLILIGVGLCFQWQWARLGAAILLAFKEIWLIVYAFSSTFNADVDRAEAVRMIIAPILVFMFYLFLMYLLAKENVAKAFSRR